MSQTSAFPTSILAETTLRCPADCVFCPNKKIDTRPKDMPLELFQRIVDECRGKEVEEFNPFIHGEPLAYPFLDQALEYVSQTLPNTPIHIYTNGYLLDSIKSSILLSNNVRQVHFSIDGVSKEVYEQHRRGLTYEKVIANVMDFLDRRHQHQEKIATRVTFTMTPENQHEVEAFKLFWGNLVDVVDIVPCDGRGGQSRTLAMPEGRMLPCLHLPYRAYILTDGSVVPCCKDWSGYTILGNVLETSLEAIWNSSEYIRLREDVSRGIFSNFEACRRCAQDEL